MLETLKKKLESLYASIEIYTHLHNGAEEIGDYELAERAQDLGEEVLSQMWETRKQMEKIKTKGLYFVESQPTT